MGGRGSKDAKTERQRKLDKKLEKATKGRHIEESRVRKVLLLGPGESGKSTFLKQMVINHKGGFPEEARGVGVYNVRTNVVEGMKEMVLYCESKDSGLSLPESVQKYAKTLLELELRDVREWPDKTAIKTAVETLWKQEAIQEAWNRRTKITKLSESYSYFMTRLDEVAKEGYLPTNEDLLLARVRTTGVVRENFDMKGVKLELIDVGGQKNERRKWISMFDGVTAILFLVAVSEYDQQVFEDESLNRMKDAMSVFDEIVNNGSLKDVPICFFMNKSDLFEKKFKKVSLKVCFDDWDEKNDGDLKKAYEFIETKFRAISKFKDKQITFFHTTATNSDNVKTLWLDVQALILNKNLEALQF